MPYRSARSLLVVLYATLLVAALLLLLWPDSAHGDTAIHKCRDAAGTIHYQDEPCAPGTGMRTPVIATVPATPVDSADFFALPAPTAPRPPPEPSAAPPREAPPPLFRCERYDGAERYVTSDPVPRRTHVPLWTMLGDAGSGGGQYTIVEDRCTPMSPREQCAHWRERRGEISTRRRQAFKAELATLDVELAEVRGTLAAHCGG